MKITANPDWHEVNQNYLETALDRLSHRLETLQDAEGNNTAGRDEPIFPEITGTHIPALEILSAMFELSGFEKGLLLLIAGVELDPHFAKVCAGVQGNSLRGGISFELARAVLPGAHWSALSPGGTLRRWRMIELDDRSKPFAASHLRVDPRIYFYIVGIDQIDERLDGVVHPLPERERIVPSHMDAARRISGLLSAGRTAAWPAVQLCGPDHGGKIGVALMTARLLELELRQIKASDLPAAPGEMAALARLCDREMALTNGAMLIDLEAAEPDNALERRVAKFADLIEGWLFLATPEPVSLERRSRVRFDIERPTESEQREWWRQVLAAEGPAEDNDIDQLAGTFDLDTDTIVTANAMLAVDDGDDEDRFARLWESCRAQSRRRLDGLAERLRTRSGWDDIILPSHQMAMLTEVTHHVRHATKVFRRWGFDRKTDRGQGIAALFAGASGTGKTLAAEVIAHELKRDLYRIDLSQVVSKYIGETEKNLSRVFTAAEGSGAVLLFDEADALFGKRSEVKDSHDRYANIEVGYLLQRMEAYRGLAILTTNMKDALDKAFLRRLRFIIEFPFPDAAYREAIWQRMFPEDAPLEDIDYPRLARLNVPGGAIRNIALAAAFSAARDGAPVRMPHILQAAKTEYAKLGKVITAAEFGKRA